MNGEPIVRTESVATDPPRFWPQQRRQVIATTFAMLAAQVEGDYDRIEELWRLAEHEQQAHATGLLCTLLQRRALVDDPAERPAQVDAAFAWWARMIRSHNREPDLRKRAERMLTALRPLVRATLCSGPVSKVDLPGNPVLREPLAMCLVWLAASMFYTHADGDDAAARAAIDELRTSMLAD